MPSEGYNIPNHIIVAFREVFNLFDINGGGTIDADELDSALKTVDIELTPQEIHDVLHVIDEDGKIRYCHVISISAMSASLSQETERLILRSSLLS